MNSLITALGIGIVIGIIDIIPMILQKLPRYSTISAFIHYFVTSTIIVLIDIPFLPWWLKGGILGILFMTPMLIHVGHEDKKPVPIIAFFSIFLGTLAATAGHFLV
ncbi:MAG: hypothetical protein LUG98_02805 [Tannerellaceae bacterium]|nr:hypothetical protein [Tannerellaceae bacterium]